MNSNQPPPPKKLLHRQTLGKQGEDLAAEYLRSKGYSVLHRNFRATYGELDIVALAPTRNILVFVEVKTRIGRQYGLPEESVTRKKLKEIIKTSQYYVVKHPTLPPSHRVDVIGIEYAENNTIAYFNHIENVTL